MSCTKILTWCCAESLLRRCTQRNWLKICVLAQNMSRYSLVKLYQNRFTLVEETAFRSQCSPFFGPPCKTTFSNLPYLNFGNFNKFNSKKTKIEFCKKIDVAIKFDVLKNPKLHIWASKTAFSNLPYLEFWEFQ